MDKLNIVNLTVLEDLTDLEDILNTLIFEDKPSIFTEEYTLQFNETALQLMDEIMTLNPRLIFEPNLYEILLEDITDIFYVQLEEQIDDLYDGDDIEDTINDLLEEACSIFIASFYPDKYTELIQKISQIDETIDDIDTIEDMIQHTKQECKQGSTDLVISTETQQQTNYISYIAGGLFTLFIYILM